MREKALEARRQRNQELGRMDAANRCVVCQRNLFECGEIVEDFLVAGKCCSDACLTDWLARPVPSLTGRVRGMR